MDKSYEQKYHLLEEYNWWFVARRQTVLSFIEKYPKDTRILDIGCSGGILLKVLKAKGYTDITGIDFSPEAIEQCKKNGLNNVFVMDAHYPEFKDEAFDLIISSDCLEHLKDDELALKSWNRILKRGGQVVIFVPAFMSMWSEHDIINHHFRRYTKRELVSKSVNAGFNVEKSSYWNCALFFPAYVYRRLQQMSRNKKAPKDDLGDFSPFLNNLLTFWMRVENVFFKSLGLPVGLSVMVSLRKGE
jgi:SAM-dependent methyltransferase